MQPLLRRADRAGAMLCVWTGALGRTAGDRRYNAMLNFNAVMLNPQPIPPGRPGVRLAAFSLNLSAGMLNPQPLPPGAQNGIIIVGG